MMNRLDGIYSFSDATKIWHLKGSALKKAKDSKSLKENVDCKRFGREWVVTEEAMYREYGIPSVEHLKKYISTNDVNLSYEEQHIESIKNMVIKRAQYSDVVYVDIEITKTELVPNKMIITLSEQKKKNSNLSMVFNCKKKNNTQLLNEVDEYFKVMKEYFVEKAKKEIANRHTEIV